jgi:hypothetical protein
VNTTDFFISTHFSFLSMLTKLFLLFVFLLETGSHYVAQVGFKLMIPPQFCSYFVLPWPPGTWDLPAPAPGKGGSTHIPDWFRNKYVTWSQPVTPEGDYPYLKENFKKKWSLWCPGWPPGYSPLVFRLGESQIWERMNRNVREKNLAPQRYLCTISQ